MVDRVNQLAWKQIAVAVTVGFLLGGGFGLWQGRREGPRWMHRAPEERKERVIKRFTAELQLTEAQAVEVRRIISESHDRLQALRDRVRPDFRAVREEMKRRIRALLTEEQIPRFEAMETRWEARKKGWRDHPRTENMR
ncbi:MAG: hypothetical protein COV76_04515 [Candidatus Omnitrophica bacterium CG11_big_fil_rev_8_21_14_0_20_64_10]|nr:MAG: hypothetical protein COV76_04515 [Candidatus Omnitrophica bacterium CG11_big_fil_rev_8_21_14_0_20_64_10]